MQRSNFRYIRLQTPQGIGYGCFYITWEREEDKILHYNVGLAFCSPKDKFNKRLAREIAIGRHNNKPIFDLINSDNFGSLTEEEFDSILYKLFAIQHIEIPKWAYTAYNLGNYIPTLSLKRS
jgi:hypothetical protein